MDGQENFREILDVSLLYLYPDRLATANFIGREHNLSGQNLQPENIVYSLGKHCRQRKKEVHDTMKRKWIAAAGLSVFMIAAGVGCAKEPDAQTVSVNQESLEDADKETGENSALQEKETDNANSQPGGTIPAADSKSEKTEFLNGMVCGVSDDAIVIIKIETEETEEEGVSLAVAPAPENATEEDYVGVNFTEQTKFELHTVKNGGTNPEEDVTVKEASPSDIKSEMIVNLEGSYDGDTFVAEKVVLYEFV